MQSRSRPALAADWPPSREVAHEAGHQPQSPLKAIRKKCRDCSGGSLVEVRRCEAVFCVLWPFRAGRHPWHSAAKKNRGNPPNFSERDPFHERPEGRQ